MRRIAFVVLAVALGAALWWSFGSGGELERSASQADDFARVQERAEVELAASASAARSDAREAVAHDAGQAPATATETVVVASDSARRLPCGVRVVRGDEPVPGASVELVHATTGAVLQLVTGDDGLALVEEGTFERGPWLAIAGVRGLCNRGLVPVEIDGELRQPEVLVQATSHLAIRFERSDSAPIVPRADERMAVTAVANTSTSGGSYVRFAPGGADEPPLARRCLVLAGLRDQEGVHEHHVWQSNLREARAPGIAGRWYQLDAASTEIHLQSAGVEHGGAFTVVRLEVDATVRIAAVEIDVSGGPVANPIESSHAAFVHIEHGDRRYVRELRTSRGTRFAVPEGRLRMKLAFVTLSAGVRRDLVSIDVVCEASASRLEVVPFDMSSLGAIEYAGAVPGEDGTTHLTVSDAESAMRTIAIVSPARPFVFVRAGSYFVGARQSDGVEPCVPRQHAALALPAMTEANMSATQLQRAIVRAAAANDTALAPLLEHFRLDVSAGAVTVAVPFTP